MPSGLIKLIYTGEEERVFYTNPSIKLFNKVLLPLPFGP